MPSLNATFLGDTRNLDAVYTKSASGAKAVSDAIVAGMNKTAAALKRQIALSKLEGKSYAESAAALAILNKERAAFQVNRPGSINNTGIFGNAAAKQNAIDSGAVVDMSTLGQYKARRLAHAKDEEEISRYEAALAAGGQNLSTVGKNRPSALLDDPEWTKKFAEAKARVAARKALEKESIDWALTQKAAQGALWSEQAIAAGAMLEKFEKDRLAAQELAKLTKVAMLEQASISARGFGGGRGLLGSHSGSTSFGGRVQEIAVLFHEAIQGRGTGRIIGSVTILGQRMGWLRKIIKTTADADVDAAMAAGKLEQKLGQEAVALEAVAVTSKEAGSATAANAKQDQMAAAAALENYEAQRLKTKALTEQAQVSLANNKFAGVGPIGVVLGIVLAVGVGMFAAYKLSKALVEKLSGIKPPDWKPEYIAKYLQKANQALEVQRAINDEIKKQNDLYDSAAEKAARIAEITKSHFDHLRKMNELSNLTERQKEQRGAVAMFCFKNCSRMMRALRRLPISPRNANGK